MVGGAWLLTNASVLISTLEIIANTLSVFLLAKMEEHVLDAINVSAKKGGLDLDVKSVRNEWCNSNVKY